MNNTAIAHFSSRLAFETDVSDVHAALPGGEIVLVDSRSTESWDQGHVPGALHLPTARIAAEARDLVPLTAAVVTYCWGPGCNGATRAALEFSKLGYQVKEMLGGFEYWAREGFEVDSATGRTRGVVDPLTAPAHAITCGC